MPEGILSGGEVVRGLYGWESAASVERAARQGFLQQVILDTLWKIQYNRGAVWEDRELL